MTTPRLVWRRSRAGGAAPVGEASLEELMAAWLDGTLDPRRRDEVAGRIAGDPQARYALAEASSFLLQADSPAARTTWVKRTFQAVAVAACATVAFVQMPGGTELADRLDHDWFALLSGEELGSVGPYAGQSEPNLLGFSGADRDSPQARSFRAGVADLDLEIAVLTKGATEDAGTEARRRLRESLGPALRLDESAAFRAMARSPGPATLGALNRELLASVPDRGHYVLGRLLEASYVAAAAGNRTFFSRPAVRHSLRQAPAIATEEESRAALERLIPATEADVVDLPSLERALEQAVLLLSST